VNSWLAGIPESRERAVLFSLAYNSKTGKTNLLGPSLKAAVQSGDRAEAFYEIRYNSNGNDDGGIAKRRYIESHIFGLYAKLGGTTRDDVTKAEAFNAFRMATRHEHKMATYDAKWSTPLTNANADLTAIEGRSQDLGTVTATQAMLNPALLRLTYDFADFDRLFTDLARAAPASVLADFNPAKVWVAASTSAGEGEVAANTDRQPAIRT
jgi:hypothetical protein